MTATVAQLKPLRPKDKAAISAWIEGATLTAAWREHVAVTKNQLAYRAATPNAEGAVPEILLQILAKAEGK